jgi:hypothetical protein
MCVELGKAYRECDNSVMVVVFCTSHQSHSFHTHTQIHTHRWTFKWTMKHTHSLTHTQTHTRTHTHNFRNTCNSFVPKLEVRINNEKDKMKLEVKWISELFYFMFWWFIWLCRLKMMLKRSIMNAISYYKLGDSSPECWLADSHCISNHIRMVWQNIYFYCSN